MTRTIGVLTAGCDSSGLNTAIRAVGKSAQRAYGMEVIGLPRRVPRADGGPVLPSLLGRLLRDTHPRRHRPRDQPGQRVQGGHGQRHAKDQGIRQHPDRWYHHTGRKALGHDRPGVARHHPRPVQRGGTPSPGDRLVATRLGTACADYIDQGIHGVMVAARGDHAEPVPLRDIAGIHPLLITARHLGIALGD